MPAFRIEVLAKVSLTIEQADSNYRHPQVACRLHLVACHVAQTTGVDGQRLAQHELHAEVGDRSQRGASMLVLEPCVRIVGFPIFAKQIVETHPKLRGTQCSFDLLFGNRPQDDLRILCRGPEFLIEIFPQSVRCVVPGPVQIERQLNQCIDSINL